MRVGAVRDEYTECLDDGGTGLGRGGVEGEVAQEGTHALFDECDGQDWPEIGECPDHTVDRTHTHVDRLIHE